MEKRRNHPRLCLLRVCCVALFACVACSRAVRYGMDVPTQKEGATAAGSTRISPTFEDPDWFVFLEQTGDTLVRQAAEQTLPEACKLHHAAFVGDEVQLEACIQAHPKWIGKSTNGNVTPLHMAVFQGKVDCVRLLLDAGASPRALMDAVHSCIQPIHIAAHGNGVAVLRSLLEAQRAVAADVDATGKTALHWAAAKGHTLCIRELLQAGSALNGEDNQGHTPICLALAGNHVDAVSQLLDAGAHLGCVTCMHDDSDRLLWWALAHKAYPCIAALVRQGNVLVDLDSKDVAGQTLLDRALETGHFPSIRSLLQRASGANWANHTDRLGNPLLHRLVAGNHPTLLAKLLAEATLDVNAQDVAGKTALHLAAEQNLSSAVRSLLAVRGIEVNKRDNQGSTALYVAVAHQHREVAQILMQLPTIEVLRGNRHNQTLLEIAFGANYLPFLAKAFEAGEDVNATDEHCSNKTRLHQAAAAGRLEMVEALLKVPGIDVHVQDRRGYTPLHWAAVSGHAAVVEALLKVPGVDVHAQDRRGYTPLHWAALLGRLAVVEALLRVSGIDVNARNHEDVTPLHGAAREGHAAVVNALLQVPGIEVNAKNNEALTPLHAAAEAGRAAVVELLLQVPGIDVHARDSMGLTPLRRAACGVKEGHAAAVEAFLKLPGIEVPAKRSGYTPLHWAAVLGDVTTVESLLKIPENEVNARNQWGDTPLHRAAYGGRAAVVEGLLKVPGVELHPRNNRDKTPLEVAQERLQVAAEEDEDLKQRLSACIALLSKPVGS